MTEQRASAGSDLSSFDALQGGETLTLTGSGTSASANVANGIAMSSNGTLALLMEQVLRQIIV